MWIGLIAAALAGSVLTQSERLHVQFVKMGLLGSALFALGVAGIGWVMAWVIAAVLAVASVATCVRARSEV